MTDSKWFFNGDIPPWIIAPLHEDWAKVFPLGTSKSWPKKSIVQPLGAPPTEIILIRRGLMNILAFSPNGDQRNICILGPGSILGETSLFCGVENRHTICATENCEGIVFQREVVFRDIMGNFSSLSKVLCRNLAIKSYIMSTQLECVTFMSVKQRLAHFLCHLAMEQEKNKEAYQQIAALSLVRLSELIGLHRVTVTNEINAFQKQNILARVDGKLVVKDTQELLRILHQPR